MLYRKLKRTWSNGYSNHIPDFKKVFPELSKIDSEEMCDRFIELGIEFYTEERVKVNPLVRLTLPFGLLVMLIMFIGLPLNFIVTGNWGYSLGEKNLILNWLRALKLQ